MQNMGLVFQQCRIREECKFHMHETSRKQNQGSYENKEDNSVNTGFGSTRGLRIDIQCIVFLETVITTTGTVRGGSEEIFLLAKRPAGSTTAGGFILLDLLPNNELLSVETL